ncbi:hypothetical protein lbkm_2968 [Lachnospiraceae bacterium KM106-2]|nr:hypothetical protein lbkm_2968 [Lachnospiraceae bacterium KM106-2]
MKRHQSVMLIIVLFALIGGIGVTVEAANKKVQRISITNVTGKRLTIEKGNSYQLKTKITPSNATIRKVTYSSSNKKVATISKSGKIKAIKEGTSTIRVTAQDGSKKSVSIQLKVGKRIKKLSVQNAGSQLKVGSSFRLKVLVTPSNAANRILNYTSSNKKIVTVTSDGIVKAIALPKGKKSVKVKITISSTDGSKIKVTKTLTVTKKTMVTQKERGYIAHMGLSAEAPANSLPAFELAAKSGSFSGIETDVRETKDGKFVLYHDENLSTRTTGRGSVSSLTYAQIVSYEIKKGSNIQRYRNLRIPTLEQFLTICKEYKVTPVLHIKALSSSGYQRILNMLDSYGMLEEVSIIGGKAVVSRFRELHKNVKLSWICYMSLSGIDWAAKHNIQINSDYRYVTKDRVLYARSQGLEVGAWTVDDPKLIRNLWQTNLDFITTNKKQKKPIS